MADAKISWEYVSTFDYEWGVWTGQHKYIWTVWVNRAQPFEAGSLGR
jgi:hypothetical protein